MELKNSLKILIETTWDLHVRINEKINSINGFKFCRHCSDVHGHYCVIADDTVEDGEKMIAIRDSLQDLYNILIYLQRMESCQKTHRDAALASLEESRQLLIERVNLCKKKASYKLDVLEELTAFFGNGKTEFTWNFKEKKIEQHKIMKKVSSFLVNTTRIGIELVVVFACISSSVKFYKKRQQIYESRRKIVAPVDPREFHLDVSYGKG
ncbi:unnamed protein product [Fraxinus pennsylvanica]|uniref:Uncharacterized protein n=1 Tax=Fraxinus pennsylvanica TaxID=56036 RepID=A0AAD1ZFI5_9LAMI|nr:unnamed protein product [Fraxinus pennsylvanica]